MSKLSSNLLTLCPKCNNYPLLSLNKDHPKDILIQCDYCKYNQYTSLHNYLYHINTISHIKRNNIDNKCFGDWGLGIGDWGLGIGDWANPPIPNPQSPIPNPQFISIFYLNKK